MEEKSNVSRVQKSIGSYKFSIEGYSGLSTKFGDSVESPEFTLCGHTWQLRIFPGGSMECHMGYMSFYLASKCAELARASYKLVVLNQIVGGEDESFLSSGTRDFEPQGAQVDGWGRDKFMLTTLLTDAAYGYRVNDTVIFKVELSVFGDLESVIAPMIDSFEPNRTHALDVCLQKMLLNGVGSDLSLVVGADDQIERIPVHKCILMARSPVFMAMFTHGMAECSSHEVLIPDFSPSVVREMLHYMYTDCAAPTHQMDELAVPLMCIASKYQVAGLVFLCESHLYSQLSEECALSLLELADTYGATNLKQKTLHYISRHASNLTGRTEYQELDEALQRETSVAIEAASKRRGLRVACAKDCKDKKSAGFCCIM